MERVAIEQLLAIAAAQHGLVTVDQAATVGVTAPMMRGALNRGWLRRERRGVYVVGGAGPSRWRQVMAASLAAGPDAVVSHTTAAMLHRFYGIHSDEVEVTVANLARRSIDGVRVHRSATLLPGDMQHRFGMQLTTPVRTVIDLAGRVPDPLLGLILDEGAIARAWTAEEVMARLDGFGRGVAGVAQLRRLLTERLGESHPDSRFAQRVIRLIKRVVPGYVPHHRVVIDSDVIDMDIAWPVQKIDGEVDGLRTRVVSRTRFERKYLRENVLAAHGWRTVYFTAKMDDRALIAQVAPLLGLG